MGDRDVVAARDAHGGTGVVRDLLGVLLAGLGVLALALLAVENGGVPEDDAADLLVLGTVGLGTAAAILGDVSARLSGDVRPSWVAAALALYTLVVVPSGTIWPEVAEGDHGIAAATLTSAFTAILVLLVLAVRPPERTGHWAPWVVAGCGVLLAVAAARTAAALPGAFTVLAAPAVLGAVVAAWLAVSGWLVVGGLRRRDRTVWWMGLGLLVVAAGHEYRAGAGLAYDEPDLVSGSVGLVGMLAVLVGTLQLVRRGVQAAHTEQEELRVAAVHMERACARAEERDHELRNGLTGLAGITQLLSASSASAEAEQLRSAVLHELARLAAMLECDDVTCLIGPAASEGCDVTPVLADAVMLRRAAGALIELSSPPGLCAVGPPDVLAQVIGSLLGNCATHAPGAAVRVHARAAGRRVVIEVSDDGPGITPGHERLVLDKGVRGPSSDGLGLGLYVSSRLVEGVGGSLRVLPRAGRGATVVVELPGPGPDPARHVHRGEDRRLGQLR